MKNKMKKRPVTGDFVTREGHDGSWMVTAIAKNYEINIYQARVAKVGDPSIFDFVEPESLTVIEKKF